MTAENTGRFSIAVLISGSGTNLQAIIDATRDGYIPGEIALVVSDVSDAFGLERASQANIPVRVLQSEGFSDRAGYDAALSELVATANPDLIVLAGFMRILGADFVTRYSGRILNIHPALLPRHRGLHTHRRALEAGDTEHGASVHFVTAELDAGPVVLQARVPVISGDDESTLAARVLEKEHIIYPLTVRWFAEGRLRMQNGTVELDGEVLAQPIMLEDISETNA